MSDPTRPMPLPPSLTDPSAGSTDSNSALHCILAALGTGEVGVVRRVRYAVQLCHRFR